MDNGFLSMMEMAADIRQAARLSQFTEHEAFQMSLEFLRCTLQHQFAQSVK